MSDPKCPYCSHTIDTDERYEDGEDEIECGECEKKLILNTSISIDHEVQGDCRLNNELPHVLVEEPMCFLDSKPTGRFNCKKCKKLFYDFQMPGAAYPCLKVGDFVIEEAAEKKGR